MLFEIKADGPRTFQAALVSLLPRLEGLRGLGHCVSELLFGDLKHVHHVNHGKCGPGPSPRSGPRAPCPSQRTRGRRPTHRTWGHTVGVGGSRAGPRPSHSDSPQGAHSAAQVWAGAPPPSPALGALRLREAAAPGPPARTHPHGPQAAGAQGGGFRGARGRVCRSPYGDTGGNGREEGRAGMGGPGRTPYFNTN